jgi:hypothetical protein
MANGSENKDGSKKEIKSNFCPITNIGTMEKPKKMSQA